MKIGKQIDLLGTICPYCVMNIIKDVLQLKSGENMVFVVDDPLAPKAVEEELGEYENLSIDIEKKKKKWEIKISNTDLE